ncbi:UNVERIFIED_CONTAM: hypothetical protein FKN15_046422 [Acipenser sinensis]
MYPNVITKRHVVETYFGFDEESVDSETSSLTSYNTDRTDRTPVSPEDDLDEGILREESELRFRQLTREYQALQRAYALLQEQVGGTLDAEREARTREHLQADLIRYQGKIEDLERSLAERGQERDRLMRWKKTTKRKNIKVPKERDRLMRWKKTTKRKNIKVPKRLVVETYFGFDEESVDSETSSLTSYNTDRTPATPEEDLDEGISREESELRFRQLTREYQALQRAYALLQEQVGGTLDAEREVRKIQELEATLYNALQQDPGNRVSESLTEKQNEELRIAVEKLRRQILRQSREFDSQILQERMELLQQAQQKIQELEATLYNALQQDPGNRVSESLTEKQKEELGIAVEKLRRQILRQSREFDSQILQERMELLQQAQQRIRLLEDKIEIQKRQIKEIEEKPINREENQSEMPEIPLELLMEKVILREELGRMVDSERDKVGTFIKMKTKLNMFVLESKSAHVTFESAQQDMEEVRIERSQVPEIQLGHQGLQVLDQRVKDLEHCLRDKASSFTESEAALRETTITKEQQMSNSMKNELCIKDMNIKSMQEQQAVLQSRIKDLEEDMEEVRIERSQVPEIQLGHQGLQVLDQRVKDLEHCLRDKASSFTESEAALRELEMSEKILLDKIDDFKVTATRYHRTTARTETALLERHTAASRKTQGFTEFDAKMTRMASFLEEGRIKAYIHILLEDMNSLLEREEVSHREKRELWDRLQQAEENEEFLARKLDDFCSRIYELRCREQPPGGGGGAAGAAEQPPGGGEELQVENELLKRKLSKSSLLEEVEELQDENELLKRKLSKSSLLEEVEELQDENELLKRKLSKSSLLEEPPGGGEELQDENELLKRKLSKSSLLEEVEELQDENELLKRKLSNMEEDGYFRVEAAQQLQEHMEEKAKVVIAQQKELQESSVEITRLQVENTQYSKLVEEKKTSSPTISGLHGNTEESFELQEHMEEKAKVVIAQQKELQESSVEITCLQVENTQYSKLVEEKKPSSPTISGLHGNTEESFE